MPSIDKHVASSIEKTGKEFREVHEWLDGDPEMKALRHDITKIHEHGRLIEERFGREGLDKYIRHLHDDMMTRFGHLREDFDRALTETLSYFGVK